jgi:hypothetical protein
MGVHLDWIAHGLIDSVVDAFSPLIKLIEKEVDSVDSMVLGLEDEAVARALVQIDNSVGVPSIPSETDATLIDEKSTRTSGREGPVYSRLNDRLRGIVGRRRQKKPAPDPPPSKTLTTLLRMTSTRRLVTALTRLLTRKGEVVSQLRKRLLLRGASSESSMEVGVYLGDVQGIHSPSFRKPDFHLGSPFACVNRPHPHYGTNTGPHGSHSFTLLPCVPVTTPPYTFGSQREHRQGHSRSLRDYYQPASHATLYR